MEGRPLRALAVMRYRTNPEDILKRGIPIFEVSAPWDVSQPHVLLPALSHSKEEVGLYGCVRGVELGDQQKIRFA